MTTYTNDKAPLGNEVPQTPMQQVNNGQQLPPQYPAQAAPQGLPTHRFQNATPLLALNRSEAPVDCPMCGQRDMTVTEFETGGATHLWALGLCCLACLGCIPYCVKGFKDCKHSCRHCGALLATWHRSGHTEVHAFA